MGGKVAVHLSSTIESLSPTKSFPRLQVLILLAPAPPTPLILPEEMAKQQLTAYDGIEAATFVIAHVLSSSPLPENVVSSLATNALAVNQYAIAAWPKYGMQENTLEEARNIILPTLVFADGYDKVETVERLMETFSNLSRVAEERNSLMVLDGIGHLMMLEAPDKLNREIQRFVDGVMHVVSQIKD
ncbi:hypothetical protein BOTCAL_0337g00070 [Botryotinia calthae]|uniref:AB hydrolase-1 domain-containing protein n=1 Tax=Botryotinia calthae TaxID=38488 RepID=A0A4Y8CSZ4_9HELO|nr:hypothetical protein BOTCAL_0337g00070 [Botryotinia calthae]